MPKLKKPGKHPVRALLLLTQPTVMVLIAMVLLMLWRVPTLIQVDIIVDLPEPLSDETELFSFPELDTFSSFKIKQGKIHYPDFPKKESIVLTTPVRIELKPLATFQVKEISRDLERKEIRLQISGIVERIRSTVNGVKQDHRLTRFEELTHSRSAMFLGIAAWVVLTAIGWYKVYQELKA